MVVPTNIYTGKHPNPSLLIGQKYLRFMIYEEVGTADMAT